MNNEYTFNKEDKQKILGDKIDNKESFLSNLEKFMILGYKLIEYSRNKNKQYYKLEHMIDILFNIHQGLDRLDYLDYYIKKLYNEVSYNNIT